MKQLSATNLFLAERYRPRRRFLGWKSATITQYKGEKVKIRTIPLTDPLTVDSREETSTRLDSYFAPVSERGKAHLLELTIKVLLGLKRRWKPSSVSNLAPALGTRSTHRVR
jgi:hypothetical protein